MIYDSLSNASVYRTLGPRFAQAFDFLAQFKVGTPDGRVSLEGDNVYALIQSNRTAPAADKPFESHQLYADVQFVAAGEEIIGTAPLDRLTVTKPYSAAIDAALYSGPDDTPLRLRAGDFCVLWPQDGHKPGCQWNEPMLVKKVVVKVRL
jgi:YhcH/YjgK/YiaL family protein